jgi:hypothetical protein
MICAPHLRITSGITWRRPLPPADVPATRPRLSKPLLMPCAVPWPPAARQEISEAMDGRSFAVLNTRSPIA